eukprot:m.85688 g.85688  ORF g.85688 m.85688 type:complete len:55 (-) comp12785_c0_seq2:2085-2249(-)
MQVLDIDIQFDVQCKSFVHCVAGVHMKMHSPIHVHLQCNFDPPEEGFNLKLPCT